MAFTSPIFFLFFLAAAAVSRLLALRVRVATILALSAVFAATYVPNVLAAVPLLAFAAGGYAAIMLAARRGPGLAVAVLTATIVALFVWLKRYPFVQGIPPLPFPYIAVGLSYILFRVLHLLFEVRDGMLQPPSFGRYLAYLFFFPAFLSGPINRYEPFAADLDTPAPMDADIAFGTLRRLLTGLFKVAVAGELVLLAQKAIVVRLDIAAGGGAPFLLVALLLAGAAGLYLVFLYANFSGYTDMAIAIARLFGIVLPENFDSPFTASNFQDFWSRWHISLSEWFKVYFFNPLLKGLMRRWSSASAAPYLGVLASFVVFLVLGAWHGASWEFLLCGVMLGTGIAANKLYQVEMVRRLGKKRYRALAKTPLHRWAARGLTLSWISLALIPFWRSVGMIAALVQRIGVIGSMATLISIGAAFVISLALLETVRSRLSIERHAASLTAGFGGQVIALAAVMLILAFAIPMLSAPAEFVYKAF
jgi:alginate O-acetyltransferase complex protein AlgI